MNIRSRFQISRIGVRDTRGGKDPGNGRHRRDRCHEFTRIDTGEPDRFGSVVPPLLLQTGTDPQHNLGRLLIEDPHRILRRRRARIQCGVALVEEPPANVIERRSADVQALAELGDAGSVGGKWVIFDDLAADGRREGSRHSPLSKPSSRRDSVTAQTVIKVVRHPANNVLMTALTERPASGTVVTPGGAFSVSSPSWRLVRRSVSPRHPLPSRLHPGSTVSPRPDGIATLMAFVYSSAQVAGLYNLIRQWDSGCWTGAGTRELQWPQCSHQRRLVCEKPRE